MIGTVRGMRRDEIESSKSPVTQISLVIDSATRSRPETSIVDLDSRARRQKYGTPDNLFNHWNRKQHFLQSSAFFLLGVKIHRIEPPSWPARGGRIIDSRSKRGPPAGDLALITSRFLGNSMDYHYCRVVQ
jgi:hypothetical protein